MIGSVWPNSLAGIFLLGWIDGRQASNPPANHRILCVEAKRFYHPIWMRIVPIEAVQMLCSWLIFRRGHRYRTGRLPQPRTPQWNIRCVGVDTDADGDSLALIIGIGDFHDGYGVSLLVGLFAVSMCQPGFG